MKNINILETKEYQVTNLINSDTFEAMNNKGQIITLHTKDKIISGHQEKFDSNIIYDKKWIRAIDEHKLDTIKFLFQRESEKQ